MIEFATASQREAYERIGGLLTQLYGESVLANPDLPVYWINYGSASTGIGILDWGGDRVYARIFAWVVTEVRANDELARVLIEANQEMRLGAFALDSAGDVEFAYGVCADELTKAQLRDCVHAVMTTADRWDDMIVARFGGLRARDRGLRLPIDFERDLDEAGLRLPPTDE